VPSGSKRAPDTGPHAMVRLPSPGVIGIGIETADMLVRENPVAQSSRSKSAGRAYAGLTGSPDESGFEKPREGAWPRPAMRGLRRGLIQLAWRFLMFQERQCAGAVVSHADRGSEPARARTTMIVALARKLLIALWRLVTTGEVAGRCRVCGRRREQTLVSKHSRTRKGQTGFGS